jgi:hypothetical protein
MDTTTLLIVIVVLLLLFGSGFYGVEPQKRKVAHS